MNAVATAADLPHHNSSRRYSIGKVLAALADDKQPTGLEGEVHSEMSRRYGNARGVWIPFDSPIGERRDLTTVSGAGAVQTNYQPTLVDALRARMVLAELGATFYLDLPPGKLQLPNLTTASNFAFVAEGASPAQASPVLAPTTLSPFLLASFVDMTRSTRASAGPGIDKIYSLDLARGLASQIDRVALAGAGSSANEPDGLIFNADVPTVSNGTNGAAITWAKLAELEETVGANGGEDSRPFPGLVTTCKARRAMRLTEKNPGAGPIWGDSDVVLSVPAYATTNLPSNGAKGTGTGLSSLLYGSDWSLMSVGLWGGIDLLIDPFKFASTGGVRVSCVVGLDTKCRNSKAFAKMVDIVA